MKVRHEISAEEFTRIWTLAITKCEYTMDPKAISVAIVNAASDYLSLRTRMTAEPLWSDGAGLIRMERDEGEYFLWGVESEDPSDNDEVVHPTVPPRVFLGYRRSGRPKKLVRPRAHALRLLVKEE